MITHQLCSKCGNYKKEIIRPWYTKNGKRIYPKNARFFKFHVCEYCKNK